jgi:hypothetical protein
MVGLDKHVVHAAQVDHEPIAQGATGPVVSTAPYRQRKIRVACCENCQLHVLRRPAVDDSARHAADWLCPERRCGDYRLSPGLETRPGSCPSSRQSVPSIKPVIVLPLLRPVRDTLVKCVLNGRIDQIA